MLGGLIKTFEGYKGTLTKYRFPVKVVGRNEELDWKIVVSEIQ